MSDVVPFATTKFPPRYFTPGPPKRAPLGRLQYLPDAAVAKFHGSRKISFLEGGAHRHVLGRRNLSPEHERFRPPTDPGIERAHEHLVSLGGRQLGRHDLSVARRANPELPGGSGARHHVLYDVLYDGTYDFMNSLLSCRLGPR
jgi:hypothetical protein